MPTRADGPDDRDGALRFRTIWISDVHLGTPGCQADLLLDFLRNTESQRLYLVGDIVDGWQLQTAAGSGRGSHNDVVQKLLRKARKGDRGRLHPRQPRRVRSRLPRRLTSAAIDVREDDVHETADGRRLLVMHGDHFDGVVQCARWLAFVGDRAYSRLLHAQHAG